MVGRNEVVSCAALPLRFSHEQHYYDERARRAKSYDHMQMSVFRPPKSQVCLPGAARLRAMRGLAERHGRCRQTRRRCVWVWLSAVSQSVSYFTVPPRAQCGRID